jgi:hypothetical protein
VCTLLAKHVARCGLAQRKITTRTLNALAVAARYQQTGDLLAAAARA